MTIDCYQQLNNIEMVIIILIYVALNAEAQQIIWAVNRELACVNATICEAFITTLYSATDVERVMGPVITTVTVTLIVVFMVKMAVIPFYMPAVIRSYRLAWRCKNACRQNTTS